MEKDRKQGRRYEGMENRRKAEGRFWPMWLYSGLREEGEAH
jgi:hypothetical protein